MIVDSHCHMNYKELSSDIKSVMSRAKEAGVGILQTISTKVSEFDKILAIAKAYDNIYCSVGVHPHEVEGEGIVSVDKLVELSKDKKVIGIGETGLDYYYENSHREMQKESFINHIAASRETGLPLIVHTRSSDDDTIEILKTEMNKGVFPGLIHCFTSTEKLARECIDMGIYISISGIITFKKADELRSTIQKLPLDRLLIETDAPYLAPAPMRGKPNEPSYIKYTAAKMAEIFGKEVSEIEASTTKNFFELFTKAKA
jgi:TatD DNase family protein